MSIQVELNNAVLEALRSSPSYRINGEFGLYLAAQNPWKEPVQITYKGSTVAILENATDWLTAPSNFVGIPKITVYSSDEFAMIAEHYSDSVREEVTRLAASESVELPKLPTNSSDSFEVKRPVERALPGLTYDSGWSNGASASQAPIPGNTPQQYLHPEDPRRISTGVDSGRNLAVVGLVLAFFAPLIGIFFSVMGRNRGVKENQPSTKSMGLVGIIINSIFLAFGALFWFFVLIGFAVSISEQSETPRDSSYYDLSSEDGTNPPEWWSGSEEKILAAANRVQPGWESNKDAVCSYGYVSNYYVNNNTSADPLELQAALEAELTALYPEAEVGSAKKSGSSGDYYKLELGPRWDDNNAEYPTINIYIYNDYLDLNLDTKCV